MKNQNILITLFFLFVGLLCSCKQPVQTQTVYPSVIEIVCTQQMDSITMDNLTRIIQSKNITPNVYQWKNRIVLYDTFQDMERTKKELETSMSGVTVRLYEQPFYIFDRALDCDEKTVTAEWEHTLMTANLVADTILQKEYMDYHATQPEKFPEVRYGFCKAEFQELLVFRNGRQLMLIISIPKGKTLTELDPKTTEDNLRMVEWNSLMSKYQEGVEGTQPGESWVMFAPVTPKQ